MEWVKNRWIYLFHVFTPSTPTIHLLNQPPIKISIWRQISHWQKLFIHSFHLFVKCLHHKYANAFRIILPHIPSPHKDAGRWKYANIRKRYSHTPRQYERCFSFKNGNITKIIIAYTSWGHEYTDVSQKTSGYTSSLHQGVVITRTYCWSSVTITGVSGGQKYTYITKIISGYIPLEHKSVTISRTETAPVVERD